MTTHVTKWLAAAAVLAVAATAVAQDGQLPGKDQRRPIKRRPAAAAQVNKAAPDFELKTVDGKQSVRLSSFQDKKPVALVFGSYT